MSRFVERMLAGDSVAYAYNDTRQNQHPSRWVELGFVKVASVKDLEVNPMIGAEAKGKQILLSKSDGGYFAIGNVCTHMGCMLSDGELKGEVVQCACHGSQFNVKTGKVIGGPAKKQEPTFEVKVEKGQILVNL